jgi:hypothetical protein
MEWLCWLALLRGGAETLMAAPPSVQERMAAIRTHRWLSPREKLERLAELFPECLTDREAAILFSDSLEPFVFCVPPLVRLRWRRWAELPLWDRPGAPFLILKREAASIREQDLPHEEKVRRLLQLVRPGMTVKQVHLLFGEPPSVAYKVGTAAKLLYFDYGLTIALDADGNVAEVKTAKDSPLADVWAFPEPRTPQEQQVFQFWTWWWD